MMLFKQLKNISESYLVKDGASEVITSLKPVVLTLSGIRNDFIYLHINTFGLSFKTLHEKFDEYYNYISGNIDTILEIIGMYSNGDIDLDLNLNTYASDKADWLQSEENLIYAARGLIEVLLNELDKARNVLSKNEAIASDLDSIASFWSKEHAYILKRFIS